MGCVTDAVRPYWMPGIHAVSGRSDHGLREWVSRKNYQVYLPIAPDRFSLATQDARAVAMAFAGDVARFSSAAMETITCSDHSHKPKACAWIIIRAYYAAYFAGNVLSRVLGTSTSQLDSEHAKAVHAVASIFGQAAGVPSVQCGLFQCVFDQQNNSILCTKLSGSSGGAHELFWSCFLSLIRRTGDRILKDNPANAQLVAAKLFELTDNLCFDGKNGGNWLSFIRNEVTYRHGMGAWFPYREGVLRKSLRDSLSNWSKDPIGIELVAFRDSPIHRFAATCSFLVALCRETLEDMAWRCPTGKSFLASGPHAYLSQIAVAERRATAGNVVRH